MTTHHFTGSSIDSGGVKLILLILYKLILNSNSGQCWLHRLWSDVLSWYQSLPCFYYFSISFWNCLVFLSYQFIRTEKIIYDYCHAIYLLITTKTVVCLYVFLFWPLHCLSFNVRLMITPLVSSNFSCLTLSPNHRKHSHWILYWRTVGRKRYWFS
jgi:hypothetical protein